MTLTPDGKRPLVGLLIMVVDDEIDSREVLSILLTMAGATLLEAANGQQAAQVVATANPKPDLVITDLSMPVADGFSLLASLQADPATAAIPVVALTAHAMPADGVQVMQAGFRHYFTKPIKAGAFIGQLLAAMRAMPEFADRLPMP